jgi:hypothetical protein
LAFEVGGKQTGAKFVPPCGAIIKISIRLRAGNKYRISAY